MKPKTIKAVQTLTVRESLLGLGMVVVTAGTTAILASNYLHGMVCVAVGFGILFFRGYLKNGFAKK
jgi:hypothetical protein